MRLGEIGEGIKQTKEILIEADNSTVITRGKVGWGRWGRVNGVNGDGRGLDFG